MTYLSKSAALTVLVKHSHLYQTRYIKIEHEKYGEFFGNKESELVEKRLQELTADKLISRNVTATSSIITVLEEGYAHYKADLERSLAPCKEITSLRKAAHTVAEIADRLQKGNHYYKDLQELEIAVDNLKLQLELIRESETVYSS